MKKTTTTLPVIGSLAMLFAAQAVYAGTWYLMAADAKAISEPRAATMMVKGSIIGPLRFVSRGEFPSRSQCESARHNLIQDWRRHSITARGGWSKYGFSSPNVFAQCTSAGDPRLSKVPGANPSMDILLQTRRIR